MEEEKRSKIEDIQRKLYSKNEPQIIDEGRKRMARGEYIAPSDWSRISERENMPKKNNSERNLKIALIISILFFLISGGFAVYMFLRGGNTVSAQNVEISAEGPTEISSGETTTWDIAIKNNNNVEIDSLVLSVEYPEGTKSSDKSGSDLTREKFTLEKLKPGEEKKQTISAILYGEKGSQHDIKMIAEFRVTGSSAVFSKNKIYEVEISSAPLVIDVDYPSEVSAGEELAINLQVTSNSDITLSNVLLKGEYPFGFEFTESEPKALFENNIWKINELKPGDKQSFILRGKLIGGEGEERIFRFSSGTADPNNQRKIISELARQNIQILLNRPFINLTTDIENTSAREYITTADKNTRVSLGWKNNLKDKVIDSTVEIVIGGEVFNKNELNAGGGIYRPEQLTVMWDKTNVSSLGEISPGESGSVGLSLKATPYTKLQNKNIVPEIILKMKMTGKQVSESGISKVITQNIERKIKISSDLAIDQKITYSTGPFKNTGPIPPKADQETTYTITWSLSNTYNTLKTTKVTATIPSYVKWLGKISPLGEGIAFNPTTNQITWNAGEVKRGVGYGSAAKEVSFQVTLKPSVTQVGDAPEIISKVKVTAEDQFTLQTLSAEKSKLTTMLSSDPNFDYSAYRVVK